MSAHVLKLSNAPSDVVRSFEECAAAIANNPEWYKNTLVHLDINTNSELTVAEKEAFANILRWIRAELHFKPVLPNEVVIDILPY